MLSAHTETEYIDKALDAGAVAYVVKSAHPDDLASAIRQAFQHSVYFAGSRPAPAADVAGRRGEQRGRGADAARAGDPPARRRGPPNATLAKMLWVTEQTVKFHLSNVYRKLDVANRTEAARWAQLNGLLPATGQLSTRIARASLPDNRERGARARTYVRKGRLGCGRAEPVGRQPRRAADAPAGIGSRTAQRLAFHVLSTPKEEALALAAAITEVKERVRFCRECGNLTEEELCAICLDPAATAPSSASSSSPST